jgi:hypothetical protein
MYGLCDFAYLVDLGSFVADANLSHYRESEAVSLCLVKYPHIDKCLKLKLS